MLTAEIIAELQRVAAVVGTTTLVQGDVRQHSDILGMNVLRNRFGSFADALAAAGLHHSRMANRWTEDDYLDSLRRVWAALRPCTDRNGDESTSISDHRDQLSAPVRVVAARVESGRWGRGLALPGELGRDGPQKDVRTSDGVLPRAWRSEMAK
jgi:hypothetical protein